MKTTDLNLLPILERLIATQSVTASARGLDMSVPAVSRALGKLRNVFRDELLVRSGRRMVLTPTAERIYPQLKLGLAELDGLERAAGLVRLEEADQHFKIRCDDIFAGELAYRLTQRLRHDAPNLRIELLSETATSDDDIRAGRIDLELGGRAGFPDEVVVRTLGHQRLVTLMRADHELNSASATVEAVFQREHVLAGVQTAHERPLVEALTKLGLRRKVGIVVPSYYAAGVAVSNSSLIATMPAVMGHHLARLLNLTTRPLHVDIAPIQASVAWHSRFRKDPIHGWLRRQVIELLSNQLELEESRAR